MNIISNDHNKINRFGRSCLPLLLGGLLLCAACSPDPASTEEAPIPSHYHTESETIIEEEITPRIETGVTIAEPEETVDMSSMMSEAAITIIDRDGVLGEFDFFTCNETQLFGDFSIRLAEYDGEEYMMLSHNGIALLAKEDGSDAKLFYNDQAIGLPFPCYFNLDYEFLALYPGDFLRNGGQQLALVIPMETGSGLDVEQLQIIDLDAMSVIPIHTQNDDYPQRMTALFDDHFAQTHAGVPYQLFQYIQYDIHDGLIFAEYGACDEDGNYLCFLNASLSYDGTQISLDPEMSFQDHMN